MANHGSEEHEHPIDAEATQSAQDQPAAPESASEPDIDGVIARLDTLPEILPVGAIQDARRLRPQIIPRLIELLRKATEEARSGKAVTTDGYFMAMYLLAEFRAKEALPAILDLIRANDAGGNDLLGDAITDSLCPIFAVLADDQQELIVQLIDDKEVNVWARWSAIGTYMYWVRDGALTREAAVERLRQHLIRAMREDDLGIISPLLFALGDFGAKEAEAEINEAFDRDLVDLSQVDGDQLQIDLEQGEEKFKEELERCPKSGISDMIEELSTWASYDQGNSGYHPRDDYEIEDDFEDEFEDEFEPSEPGDTIRNESPRVGRNDPCPCGSGKKYKKCCGRNQ